MEPKPFSMGVRIEHPQRLVNESQYGPFADAPGLARGGLQAERAAAGRILGLYVLHVPGRRMSSRRPREEGGVVTNGMSDHARDGENANAALLVTLNPEDFPDRSPLGGMYWQRQLEQTAFRAGGGNYRAPAQLRRRFSGEAAVADARRRAADVPPRRDAAASCMPSCRSGSPPFWSRHCRSWTGSCTALPRPTPS